MLLIWKECKIEFQFQVYFKIKAFENLKTSLLQNFESTT